MDIVFKLLRIALSIKSEKKKIEKNRIIIGFYFKTFSEKCFHQEQFVFHLKSEDFLQVIILFLNF